MIAVFKPEDRIKAALPSLIATLKPAGLMHRSEMVDNFEAMRPIFVESAQKRLGELSDALALVYAKNFTAAELRDIIAFYRSPIGEKLLARQAIVAQETTDTTMEFCRMVVRDVQQGSDRAK